jgi:hypothetical protein
MRIILGRPRAEDLVTFNSDTLDFVTTRDTESEAEYIVGNVTRFNLISSFGRLYSEEEQRVVSFELEKPDDQRVKGLAIDSMKENVQGGHGHVRFLVFRVVSSIGQVKKYIVRDISRMAQA